MKKTIQQMLLMLGVSVIVFFSCEKESTQSFVNERMSSLVNTWLVKQQNPNRPTAAKISKP